MCAHLPLVVFICPHLQDPTEFRSQRQCRVAAKRVELVVILNVWKCTESAALKFLCVFSGLDHVAFGALLWPPSWGFILQMFLRIIPPPSSLSASRLFSLMAKEDNYFKLIQTYFDL